MKNSNIKPFLKWAGGKSQLMESLIGNLPSDFDSFDTYIEPFIGSGAMLFKVGCQFKNIKKFVIADKNEKLVNTYLSIKYDFKNFINELEKLKNTHNSIDNIDEKRDFFLENRAIFNSEINEKHKQAALFIYLNKTCFNGLYRVNKKNEFNVPFGKHKNPGIYDFENLKNIHKFLKKVTILNADYSKTEKYINGKTFFYFDPPYKPLTKTASFNSYNFEIFSDSEQERLSDFCKKINQKKDVFWLLSNSDMKNIDIENQYFDDLYKDFNIERVLAKRSINSKGTARGNITELLIKNY
ncbi:DNA adenine methylase [Chryseobacterium oryctis]|uniref:site-specific DNA-methyltransferase (adenine-specific) n=1 Tax=Chryseobacterium oryctis TaxID=2952618 RepID=A0ABT3HLL1_9FLAO|nr:Dam family site-specific DNA-(adenine-N6)-methyltransferase [Chryseobacterium oryctis]MCW3160662.1 Dam family site-specific DNA-(adenine-N6)-methyltransferase [Chryseobacterium oryctis]